jgi:hypothetical protein
MDSISPTTDSGSARHRRLDLVLEAGWYGAGFAAVLALGLVNLYFPFGSDQAVFFFGARELDQGATLYVDYWDNKQPGLYVFYLLAGRLFGFSEYGVHLLELIWMMAFAVVLMVTLRPYLKAPWLSALAPLATIGIYYATAGEYELTQLEMMVAFPLYLSGWCALCAVEIPSSGKRLALLFFLSGLFAAVATLFKLLLAPIPVAFWLVASFYLFRTQRLALVGLVAQVWLPVAVGVALPFCGTLFWFWQAGALQELLWTAFIYPPQALTTSPHAPRSRLLSAAAFFVSNTAPWLLFAGIAAGVWLCGLGSFFSRGNRGAPGDPGRPGALRGSLVAMMLAWVLIAGILFLIQRFSWWQYHMLLLFTPVGVLAVLGIDSVTGYFIRFAESGGFANFGQSVKPDGSRRFGWLARTLFPAMVCSALFAIPVAASLTGPFVVKAKPLFHGSSVLVGGVRAYHWTVSENYKRLWLGSRFLIEPGARPGPIYSFGSALVYGFTGRKSSHITAGSAWEFYLPEQISEILAGFDAQQVPYIFVDRNDLKLYRERPGIGAYLDRNYRRLKKDDSGIWYERK